MWTEACWPPGERIEGGKPKSIEWSGQYENQISAKKRLELVIPVVFLIIFLLLYKTYNSFKEASHVILAVPFALSGGVFLLKLLGYNFSVAVWVGFIALFGTAVHDPHSVDANGKPITEAGPSIPV